jgi:hypothetical protein
MDPPDYAVVCCADEKTSIQVFDRTQPILPMRPGQAERRTHDYVRNGITDLRRRAERGRQSGRDPDPSPASSH